MRALALTSLFACSLAFATVPQGAIAAAPKSKSSKKKKGKGSKDKDSKDTGGSSDEGEAAVPESGAGDSERIGRVFIDTDALGEAGPFIAGRATRVVEGVFERESVTKTDALAGPELRVTISYRDSGGYEIAWEIVYNGEAVDEGTGSFECQLCTEDELVEKVEALAGDVAPKMVVPPEPDEVPGPGPEIDNGGGTPPTNGNNGQTGSTEVKPGKLGGMGKAGVGLLVVGGLAVVPGVILLARKPTHYPPGHPKAAYISTTRPAGGIFLGVGVTMVIIGAALLGVDRKRAKKTKNRPEAVLHPWLGPAGGGLGVTGRF